MRTVRNTALLLLFTISLSMTAQRKPKIKGNRVVTEVREELQPFNAIVVNDDLEINLNKSFGPGYEIEADDNLVDILKFKVEDSTLVISSFYTVTAKKKFNITVNFTDLKAITLKAGKVSSDDIISNESFFADTFGDSELNLKVNSGMMNLTMEDTSSGDFNLDVDSLNVSMNSRTDASIYSVSGTNKIVLFDNADLEIEGTTDALQANLTNNSKLKGERLEAASIKLTLQESGNAQVYAFRDLELSASGNSKTYLYGNPKITILDFLDTCQLLKKKE